MATTVPFLEKFQSYNNGKDENNPFISHRTMIDLLFSDETLSESDAKVIVTCAELKKQLEINSLKARADTDALALEESYKFTQAYKTAEFVIWNIMCLPSTLAALVEFLIHIGQKDIDWSSDIFLTFFGSAIFGFVVISYAAYFIFKMRTVWRKDIDDAFNEYKTTMEKLFSKAFPGKQGEIEPLFNLIRRNFARIKDNWLPTRLEEFRKVGFRKQDTGNPNRYTMLSKPDRTMDIPVLSRFIRYLSKDIYKPEELNDQLIAHKKSQDLYKSIAILCAAGATICVLFTSRLIHEKLALIPEWTGLTREQKASLAEFRKKINEWIAAHPNEPKPTTSSNFSSEEVSQEMPAESYIGSESFVVMISIVAALTAVCVAVYAWKQYQESQCPNHRSPGNCC